MAHFSISAIRANILVWMALAICSTRSNIIQGQLPAISVVTDFINQYVQPYMRSFKLEPFNQLQRSIGQKTVKDAIEAKIKELKHLFHNDDIIQSEDKVELDGEEETTIIEFVTHPETKNQQVMKAKNHPSETDSFKTNIRKYKKMRDKIKLALEKEPVSLKTKKMVTKTLDQIIAEMVGSQCNWKASDHKLSKTNDGDCFLDSKRLNKQLCEILKIIFKDSTKKFTSDMFNKAPLDLYDIVNSTNSKGKQIEQFLENAFHIKNLTWNLGNLFTNILKDSQDLYKKYKVRCTVVNTNNDAKSGLRQNSKDGCDDFRLCSEEVRDFLTDFYKTVNETTVSVFKNYAAMYVKDVNTDESEEKDSVIALINNLGNTVARRVSKIFIKQTSKIKLEENKNREANVKVIKEYISKTITRVLKSIKKHLVTDLSTLRAKLLLAVKQDININLKVELGNLESDFVGRVCNFFVTCNGEISRSTRRLFDSSHSKIGGNSAYVKVQLTFDDDFKHAIERSKDTLMKYDLNTPFDNFRRHVRNYIKNIPNVTVTRTTPRTNASTVANANLASIEEGTINNNTISFISGSYKE